ncbi:hypothetical protein AND_004827 [Anopheles darlingi]|uniref:Uncharacterized protein n=1 Tax=Anopheles darlingi TaxID=43151 RepID=W5JJL5_ANODA|nr:hypothetical protein AND_004827 [Anopheles darlingi]
MSMNPCKNGDREKDQNNNFVNATAHGGAGVDRERRARRAAAAARSAASEDQQLMRNGNTRNHNQHSGNGNCYHNGHQRQNGDGHHGSVGVSATSTVGSPGGGVGIGGPHVTAKVMWGNVSAIKELRDKEQSERQLGTRAAGRRQ